MSSHSDRELPPSRDEIPLETRSDLQGHGQVSGDSFEFDEESRDFKEGDPIGRYDYVRLLGQGGFGQVVEGFDSRLNRKVAIKLPHLHKFADHALSFLEEARSVARLDHPSIIRVYNVEQMENGLPFVVMEFVEGPTLAKVLRTEGLTIPQTVRYLLQIAHALNYAHGMTLIHRDIKPANVILSSKDDIAKLADFGMALHDLTPEETLPTCPQGTPPYMAPEQLRGENHRLDHRTDIWGFGVLMYTLLCGQKPFNSKALPGLVRAICSEDPISLREINRDVPAELERICFNCLEKLMKDRYQETGQLVEDLEAFQADYSLETASISSARITANFDYAESTKRTRSKSQETSHSAVSVDSLNALRIVPKGLRSFDPQDSEFFLDLLPGPKDRFGRPEVIRFWLERLDRSSHSPLNVGVIYGPSGCGKSSFVKAGLVPHLDASIRPIYLEATPHDTEQDLLEKIGNIAPNVVRDETDLGVVLSRIRRGRMMTGKKLLIVLDQFEQILSAQVDMKDQPLVEALRHCDGDNLSCLLLIRDEFWMSVSEFMNLLDLRVQEGVNALGLPLFDRRHARKVLSGYGRAMNAFPPVGEPLSPPQKRFVEEAVDQMANNGKIIPIHIAMFAQMLDSDSWHFAELKKQGGWDGIGTRFLNKIFMDKRFANLENVSRHVLTKLQPDSKTDLKGVEKKLSELTPENAGPKTQAQLKKVVELLDREFRIITVTDTEDDEACYQLAHDSLVKPIKDWLVQQENQTWRGRTRLRMKDLASHWNLQPENRFLPGVFEFLSIKFGNVGGGASDSERRYIRRATGFHATRGLLILATLLLIGFLSLYLWRSSTNARAAQQFEYLLEGSPAEVAPRLELLKQYPKSVVLNLIQTDDDFDYANRRNSHNLFAAAYFAEKDEFPLEELVKAIHQISADESANAIASLNISGSNSKLRERVVQRIENEFLKCTDDEKRIKLAVILLHLSKPEYALQLVELSSDPELRESFIETLPKWHGDLGDLIPLLNNGAEADLVSAICKSLGLIDPSTIQGPLRSRLLTALQNVFLESQSADVHSSAEFALRRIAGSVPKATENEGWFVLHNDLGPSMTFVRIPPHEFFVGARSVNHPKFPTDRWVTLDESLFVATKEVSAAMFFEFLESFPEVPHSAENENGNSASGVDYFKESLIRKYRDLDFPIIHVTGNEAILFANWFSELHGRQPRYSFDEENEHWVLNDKNGFRLPTKLEFEAISRGGTETDFPFGDSPSRLANYACAGIPNCPIEGIPVALRGSYMPNNFGIFDLIGNCYEWCEREDESGMFSSLRGGDTTSALSFLKTSWSTTQSRMDMREYISGIRLVLDKR